MAAACPEVMVSVTAYRPAGASMTKLSPSLSPPHVPALVLPAAIVQRVAGPPRQSGQNQTELSIGKMRRIMGGRHPDVEAAVALGVQLGPCALGVVRDGRICPSAGPPRR